MEKDLTRGAKRDGPTLLSCLCPLAVLLCGNSRSEILPSCPKLPPPQSVGGHAAPFPGVLHSLFCR